MKPEIGKCQNSVRNEHQDGSLGTPFKATVAIADSTCEEGKRTNTITETNCTNSSVAAVPLASCSADTKFSSLAASNKFLVSEHEDEGEDEHEHEEDQQSESCISHHNPRSSTEIIQKSAISPDHRSPAQIPPEADGGEDGDSSDYEYTYEDDDADYLHTIEVDDTPASAQKKTWVDPPPAAVSMSLQAEKETSGGRRRLASDLYKIMMGNVKDQGFSIEPQREDCMKKWKIKLFQFDEDSCLQKDLTTLGLDHVELEMTFPDQYPYEPPFVRVVQPRFKRQTGFVMNGAICSELLTNEGWNPINDIESVIVSIRSLLVVGNGRLAAAVELEEEENSKKRKANSTDSSSAKKLVRHVGTYTAAEAKDAYSHLSQYHKKKGWDTSGWWAKKG